MIDLGGMSWTDTMIEMVFTKKRSKLNKKNPQVQSTSVPINLSG